MSWTHMSLGGCLQGIPAVKKRRVSWMTPVVYSRSLMRVGSDWSISSVSL